MRVSVFVVTVLLVAFAVGSSAPSRGMAAPASAAYGPLEGTYLISASASSKTVKAPIVVEIRGPRGKVVRVVERTTFGSTGLGFGHARWSPNGRMLAWFDAQGLNVESADGTRERQLVAYSTVCKPQCVGMSYAWSPNSRTIAVGGAGNQTNHLIEVNVATGAARDAEPIQRWTQYSVIGYSPDGRRLAFAEESGEAGFASCCHSWLVVAQADGSRPRKLLSFADPIHDGPQDASWSPDSRLLAFTDDGKDVRDPKLAVVNVASGTARSFPNIAPADTSPVWSPDGSKLALAIFVSGTSYGINALTISDGTLTQIGFGDVPIAWAPDGTITTIANSNASVKLIDTTTTSEHLVIAMPKPYQLMSADPYP